ncbi:hypothetical protein K030075H31_55550 [Blautia producta]
MGAGQLRNSGTLRSQASLSFVPLPASSVRCQVTKKAAAPVIPHTICKIPGPAALYSSIILSHASVKTHGHLRETS